MAYAMNGGKMSPSQYKIIHKKIHPSEADAPFDARFP
jgi:hypothetical protein